MQSYSFTSGVVVTSMLGATSPVGLIFFWVWHVFHMSVDVTTDQQIFSYKFCLGSVTVISLYVPMIVDITFTGANMGKRMAFATVPSGIAALIGPPVTGFLLGNDYTWCTWQAIVFSSMGTAANCMSLYKLWIVLLQVVVIAAAGLNLSACQVYRKQTQLRMARHSIFACAAAIAQNVTFQVHHDSLSGFRVLKFSP